MFRSFFIKLKNPSNVIAGNSAAVQISLFNYSPNTKTVISFNLRLPLILLCFSFMLFPWRSCFISIIICKFHIPLSLNFIIINCFKVLLYIWFQDYFRPSFVTVRQMLIRYPFRIIPCHKTEIAKLNEKLEILGCCIRIRLGFTLSSKVFT